MQFYRLIEERYLDNEQSNALVYEHIVTKAKVFVMKNDDNNKTFGIGFRTPPKNDNGVCHILEHCVLNGSKKYRTKEPFMDLVKSSLQTFLNAMTYADKTIYPVASRNEKDFRNLTSVYLDAVFNPRVLEEEKIFNQEGWRYNLEDGELTYKGVVYNEMKGAMSSDESQLYKNIQRELFPDTIYGLNSGGDPYAIPTLTYSDFLEYYNEFYHPSNSYIFLYGDMDHEEYLGFIHNEYLSNYEYKEVNSKLVFQPRFNEVKETTNFLNTAIEKNANESFVSYSVITGDAVDTKNRIVAELVSSSLISNESSKLRQKLLSLGILEVVFSNSSNNLESTFSIVAKNIDVKDKDLFVKTVEDELREIVENGIDKELFLSELNDYKFNLREKGGYATKGVVYFINSFDTWLYDKSPIDAIDIFSVVEEIENSLDSGLFENYIKENILENPHKSIVSHVHKLNLNKEKDAEVAKSLKEKVNEMSENQKAELENKRLQMEIFQNRENTPEEKATIPMLSLEDVDKTVDRIDREITEINGAFYVKHNLPTSGIDYVRVGFDINHITDSEEIKHLSLLTYALTMLDTKNYSYSELNKKIYLNTGELNFDISQYKNTMSSLINRVLFARIKTFSENIDKSIEILLEVIKNTLFENTSRLKEIVAMIKANNEMRLYQNAHVSMMNRAKSNHIEELKYQEMINGIDFYLFIKELSDEKLEDTLKKLENVYKKVFRKNNLLINVASDFTNNEALENSLSKLTTELIDIEFKVSPFDFKSKSKNEGFKTSADVNYVAYGNKFKGEYDSKLIVLGNVINNEYLYSEIRAKGGAYGAGMSISKADNGFATMSYRDPNLLNTIKVYDNIPSFVDNLDLNESDLLPFIIGGVGRLNPPRTEREKSANDLSLLLTSVTYDEYDLLVQNALKSDLKSLKDFSNSIKNTLESSSLAVLGKKDTIEENKELFDEIIEL